MFLPTFQKGDPFATFLPEFHPKVKIFPGKSLKGPDFSQISIQRADFSARITRKSDFLLVLTRNGPKVQLCYMDNIFQGKFI